MISTFDQYLALGKVFQVPGTEVGTEVNMLGIFELNFYISIVNTTISL